MNTRHMLTDMWQCDLPVQSVLYLKSTVCQNKLRYFSHLWGPLERIQGWPSPLFAQQPSRSRCLIGRTCESQNVQSSGKDNHKLRYNRATTSTVVNRPFSFSHKAAVYQDLRCFHHTLLWQIKIEHHYHISLHFIKCWSPTSMSSMEKLKKGFELRGNCWQIWSSLLNELTATQILIKLAQNVMTI